MEMFLLLFLVCYVNKQFRFLLMMLTTTATTTTTKPMQKNDWTNVPLYNRIVRQFINVFNQFQKNLQF